MASEKELLEDKQFKLPHDLVLSKSCKKAIRRMKLRKKEVAALWDVFKRINDVFTSDEEPDGRVDLEELCEFLGKEDDMFIENFFELMDTDQDGVWEFGEFLLACGNFLCGTQEMLIELCFRIFDNDADGYMGEDELAEFRNVVHGDKTIYPLSIEAILKLYDSKGDGVIDMVEFEEAAHNYPVILWKIRDLKTSFVNKICGKEFWLKIFLRMHPDHIDDFYQKWKEGLVKKAGNVIYVVETIGDVFTKLLKCFCPCCCDDTQDPMLTNKNKKKRKTTKNAAADDVFPDAFTLENRLNFEADAEFEESDHEEFKLYLDDNYNAI